MRAPVYRNIEARNTFLGLAFPTEFFVVAAVYWLVIVSMGPLAAILSAIGATLAIRVIGYGRAPMFLQHYLGFMARRLVGAGRMSAVARVKAPRFPFAVHTSRDLPPRGAN